MIDLLIEAQVNYDEILSLLKMVKGAIENESNPACIKDIENSLEAIILKQECANIQLEKIIMKFDD